MSSVTTVVAFYSAYNVVITKIERQKKNPNRVNLFIDDLFAFGTHDEVLVKFGLRKGDTVNEELIKKIETEEEFSLAKQAALRFLSYRIRSEKELQSKLKEKEFHPLTIGRVTEHLRSIGMLNDKQFAQSFVHHLLSRKPAGKTLIQRELRLKGIDPDIIQEILREHAEENNEEELAEQAARKFFGKLRSSRKKSDDQIQRRRIANYLTRRGFGWSTINPILRKLFSTSSSAREE